MNNFKKIFLRICSAIRYGFVGYRITLPFFALDLSIPAFGAIMLSADVITNPAIPPKILSDSLIIISAISGFN